MNISGINTASGLYARFTVERPEKQNLSVQSQERLHEQMRGQANRYSRASFEIQNDAIQEKFEQDYQAFQDFLASIGYDGKPIAELDREEAAALVAEDGFFGVAKTAERIANFVLEGAKENEDLLRAGREGILQGFKEAEALWGDKLPEISYQTIDKAVELIDMAMHDLGFAIISTET